MSWGPAVNGPFLTVAGIFLLVSPVVLFLLRNVLARTGVNGWSWLQEESRFRSDAVQRRSSIAASVLVGFAGIVLLVLALAQ
jgi:hypothetical protein